METTVKSYVYDITKLKDSVIDTIENIEKWVKNSEKTKIIDCYDIDEIKEDLTKVTVNYKNILNTTGEKRLN